MCYATLKKYLAVLIGFAVAATGLSAAPAEEEPAAAMEKEMVVVVVWVRAPGKPACDRGLKSGAGR